jgi:hypothetical protein
MSLAYSAPALVGRHRGQDAAGLQPQRAVDAAHELGLVLGQVVVDGDDVHALAGQRVEVGRQRRDEGLALTGLHLGDVALVQRRAAHELHVEVPLSQGPLAGLPHRGEGLGEEVVERLAGLARRCLNLSVSARSSASVSLAKSSSRR